MRRFFRFIFVCLFFSPPPAFAVIKEAILYQEGALVTETSTLSLSQEDKNLWRGKISLPPQAEVETLTITPLERDLTLIDIKVSPSAFPDEREKTLQGKLNQLKKERQLLEAKGKALDDQIKFWQQQIKAKVKSQAEAVSHAATVTKYLKKAYEEKITQEEELTKIVVTIKELQQKLKSEGGEKTAWEIDLWFLREKGNIPRATLQYSYLLQSCGWLPFYIWEAAGEKAEVRITRLAELWHETPLSWNKVDITLSSAALGFSQKKEKELAGTRRKTARSNEKVSSIPYFPSLVRVGSVTLIKGVRKKIKLGEQSWPAVFTYHLRADAGPFATVMVSLNPNGGEAFPRGEALFIVDGTFVKREVVALKEGPVTFSLGEDRLISAQYDLHFNRNSETKNSWLLAGSIAVKNNHSFPVNVELELPLPPIPLEKIEVDPAVFRKNKEKLTWQLFLNGKEKKDFMLNALFREGE